MSAAPGPYTVAEERPMDIQLNDAKGWPIASVYYESDRDFRQTARLLAASWQLREALSAVMPYLQHAPGCDSAAGPIAENCYCGLRLLAQEAAAALAAANEVPS